MTSSRRRSGSPPGPRPPAIDRLERAGYVRRLGDPTDAQLDLLLDLIRDFRGLATAYAADLRG